MPALLTTIDTSPQVRAALSDVACAGDVEQDGDDVGIGDGRAVAGGAVDLGASVDERFRDGGADHGWRR